MTTGTMPGRLRGRLRQQLEEHVAPYDPAGEVDLPGFAGSLSLFAASAGALALGLRSSQRDLPDRFAAHDLLLGGVAVHKFTRLLSKGSVTAPVRAPFTEFEGPAGASEHHESARGEHGVRHTVGELLTCPFCLGVWVSSAYVAGLVAAPRATRTWAAIFTVTAVSDTLQHAYARLRD